MYHVTALTPLQTRILELLGSIARHLHRAGDELDKVKTVYANGQHERVLYRIGRRGLMRRNFRVLHS
jgi:hypothetical protein